MNVLKAFCYTLIVMLAPVLKGQISPSPYTDVKPPVNDHCANPTLIEVGTMVGGFSNKLATTGPKAEQPPTAPVSCIPTLENDLWFKFYSIDSIEWYQIWIIPEACESPAGLQAMLFNGESCEEFVPIGCASPGKMDTLHLWFRGKEPNKPYMLYVDGFDGAVCDFSVMVLGLEDIPPARKRARHERFHYDPTDEPPYTPESISAKFLNNAFTMTWTAKVEEDVDFFIVEIVPRHPLGYYRAVGNIEAKANVSGDETLYEFTDYKTSYRDGEHYCYRLVKIDSKGERSYSVPECLDVNLVGGFHVGEIKKGSTEGIYIVTYFNKVKKQNLKMEVLDENMNVLKSMLLEKEPVRDGTVSLRMDTYPPGEYFFRMSNAKGGFLRKFTVD